MWHKNFRKKIQKRIFVFLISTKNEKRKDRKEINKYCGDREMVFGAKK